MKNCNVIKSVLCLTIALVFFILVSSCSSVQYKKELARTYYNLGNAYEELGKIDDSAAAYIRALQLNHSFPRASYNLGVVSIKAEKYSQGIRVLRDILKDEPDNITVLKVLGWGYFKSGDVENAVKTYREILDIDNYEADSLYNLSLLLTGMEEFREAYPYLLTLAEIDEADGEIYYLLGEAEIYTDKSSGLNWFEKAKDKDSGNEKILTALINAYVTEEEYSSAVEQYDKLIKLNSSPEYEFEKAFLLLTAIEDYEKGLESLQKALTEGFSDQTRLDELLDYPDLLDRDRILSVTINNPIKKTEQEQESPE